MAAVASSTTSTTATSLDLKAQIAQIHDETQGSGFWERIFNAAAKP